MVEPMDAGITCPPAETAITKQGKGSSMKPEELCKRYPRLYHIACKNSSSSIKKHGLLSTSELLRECGKSDEEIRKLTHFKRPTPVTIECSGRQTFVLRDQKPIDDETLDQLLPAGVERWQWYKLINSMVFFWASDFDAKRMLRAYKDIEHDFLIVDTRKLLESVQSEIRLSSFNSGSTKGKNPGKRNLEHFKRLEDYSKSVVAEVCVNRRVDRIDEAFIEVLSGTVPEILASLKEFSIRDSVSHEHLETEGAIEFAVEAMVEDGLHDATDEEETGTMSERLSRKPVGSN